MKDEFDDDDGDDYNAEQYFDEGRITRRIIMMEDNNE